MSRQRRIANLAEGELRTGRDAVLGGLFRLSAPARSRNRGTLNCAVRELATALEQAVRYCIAYAIDEGGAPHPAEVTVRMEDLAHAADLSPGVITSLTVSVSSTAGIKEVCGLYRLANPFAKDPDLEKRVQALLDSRHLLTHRSVDTSGDVEDWYRAVEETVRRLLAPLPHGVADFYLGQAEYRRKDGDRKEAAESCSRAELACGEDIAGGRGGAGTLTRRGLALAGQGRHEEAIASYDEAIAADPNHALAHLNKGITLSETGRAEESVASCDEAIRSDPSLARAHHTRAGALAALGRNEEAPGSYDAAIRLGGPAADVYTHKGDFFARLGRVDEAFGAYDAAINADRYAARAHYGKGRLLYRAGRISEAAKCYDAAIEMDSGLADAHAGRGDTLYASGSLDKALASYDTAIEMDSGLADAHAGKGDVLDARGRTKEALDSYGRALRIEPSHRNALAGRDRALARAAGRGGGDSASG